MGRPHRLWFVRKRTQALDEGDEASTVTEVQYKWAGRKTVPSTPRVVAGQGKKGSPLLRPLTTEAEQQTRRATSGSEIRCTDQGKLCFCDM